MQIQLSKKRWHIYCDINVIYIVFSVETENSNSCCSFCDVHQQYLEFLLTQVQFKSFINQQDGERTLGILSSSSSNNPTVFLKKHST